MLSWDKQLTIISITSDYLSPETQEMLCAACHPLPVSGFIPSFGIHQHIKYYPDGYDNPWISLHTGTGISSPGSSHA